MINDSNFLNIIESKRERKIYRYISFDKLKEIFETKYLTLVNPSKWDDPFENIILNYYELRKNNREFDLQFRNCVYSQCWTYSSGSDALWRIYSTDKRGVWIRSTINKVFEELYIKNRLRNSTCFIGEVEYKKRSEIESMLNDYEKLFKKTNKNTYIAKSLLFKRKAFEHEKEIRLIYIDVLPRRKKIIRLESDPHLYIEKIMFDPRIDLNEYKINKELIRKYYGFKGQIMRSTLYQIPQILKNIYEI